jgi:hypothetical protein
MAGNGSPQVFISYSSRDVEKVRAIAGKLAENGISVWRDQNCIQGGQSYGEEIVAGIKAAKAILLVCSKASMASKNVRQEIKLGWTYDTPYIPLLIESVSYPEHVEYWLSGTQWIEVLDHPEEVWLPRLLTALGPLLGRAEPAAPPPPALAAELALDSLRGMARFGNNLWPSRFDAMAASSARLRDLGEVADDICHSFALGEKIQLRLESDQDGILTLLDFGSSGAVYCLSPSAFVPDPRIRAGTTVLPTPTARLAAFTVTGTPGREQLMAVITQSPLPFDWSPAPGQAARKLVPQDLAALVEHLRALPADQWLAFASYFDVVA